MICKHCNAEVSDDILLCSQCGQPLHEESVNVSAPASAAPVSEKPKSKVIAALFAFFLGNFGIHNFYLGYNKTAFIQLGLTVGGLILSCCTFGISSIASLVAYIWAFVEGIKILMGKINVDADGIPLE